MKLRTFVILPVSFLFVLMVLFSITNQAEAVNKVTLNVVGLYSETAAGSVSYRVGAEDWKVIKVGDQIPDNAEISVTVDRDWVELSPSNNSNAVYEVAGNEKGKVIKKVADLLKQKPRTVSFPKGGDKIDPKFANKVVVKEYLGRQVYQQKANEEWQDIKYGVVLGRNATVKIIAINNTLVLVLPDGTMADKVVGPVRFTVDMILDKKDLYKYLNVH